MNVLNETAGKKIGHMGEQRTSLALANAFCAD